ncbi:CHAT domain-containing protein [Lewinella sp. W8]|uniref:CHAT domain-containing protein n=1 Tax=Lewinella sp. W8 TaxID=2528208 RepID=UPI001566ABE2|nr:CHAT domain-containing protein [Lewinella sp. W8]
MLLLLISMAPAVTAQTDDGASLEVLIDQYYNQEYAAAARKFPTLLRKLRRQEPSAIQAKAELYYGECLYELGQYDAAAEQFLASERLVKSAGIDSTQLDFYYLILQALGTSYGHRSPEGVAYFERMANYVYAHQADDAKAVADVKYAEGMMAAHRGEEDLAIRKTEESLAIGEAVFTPLDFWSAYNNLAVLYADQQDYEKALSTQRMALLWATAPRDSIEGLFNEVLLRLELFELTEAERILAKAGRLVEQETAPSDKERLTFHSYSVLLYSTLGDDENFARSLDAMGTFFARYPEFKRSNRYQRYCNFRASYHLLARRDSVAMEWIARGAEAQDISEFDYDLFTSRLLLQAKALVRRGDFEAAANNFFYLLAFETDPRIDYRVPKPLHDFSQDPLPANLRVLKLLTERSAMFSRWGLDTKDQIYDQYAKRDIALADSLLKVIRREADQAAFRRQLDEAALELRKIEVGVAWRSYRRQANAEDLRVALDASERIKYLGITEALHFNKMQLLSERGGALLMAEKEDRKILDSLTRLVGNLELDRSRLPGLERAVKEVRSRQDARMDSLRFANDGYLEERANFGRVSLEDIRQNILREDEVLLHFVDQDSLVYIIMVSAERTGFTRVRIPGGLNNRIPALLEDMRAEDNRVYEQLHDFYVQLIAPFEVDVRSRDLVIVPDGNLGYLPFGALLMEAPREGESSMDYAYLIKNGAIRHLFNMRSGQLYEEVRPAAPDREMAAFMPFIDRGYADMPALPFSALSADYLEELLGEEVKITRGEAAREAAFWDLAPRARVLHIGTHTRINNEQPEASGLYFFPDTGEEVALIDAQEISNSSLPADLAFVSACESANGRLFKGRGIANLAQAFATAGVGNLVVNLWEVGDETSFYLQKDFYEGIYELGLPKHQALQRAQLEYLERSGDGVHPANWATMIYIGNADPLAGQNPIWPLMLLGGLVIGAVILLGLSKVRQKS